MAAVVLGDARHTTISGTTDPHADKVFGATLDVGPFARILVYATGEGAEAHRHQSLLGRQLLGGRWRAGRTSWRWCWPSL